jgi:hypothetical protein
MKTPTPVSDELLGTVCLRNIGPQEQQRRFRFGLAAFAFGALVAAVLIFAGIGRLWRIGLFLPFYLGAVGYFQARDQT